MTLHTIARSILHSCLCLLLSAVAASADAAPRSLGWRTDGTGRYAEANPPVAWDAKTNVVWQTKMPSWSNASPVVLEDRIFVCSEPATLVCVDRENGEILWRRGNTYADLAETEEEAAAIREKVAEAEKRRKAFTVAQRTVKNLRKKLKKAPEDEQLKTQLHEAQEQHKAAKAELQEVADYARPGTHGANGYSSATPYVHGDRVYVVFGNGVAACYDLAGARQWARRVEDPPHGWGFCASPVVADDTLLLHINQLWGLDPATGETRWKRKLAWSWATPQPVELADGTTVVFTGKGHVVRVSDGTVATVRLEKLAYNSPMVQDGRVYYVQHVSKAYALPAAFAADMEMPALWTSKIAKDRYYATPLVHDGLLYAVNQKGHLSILNAETGEKLHELDLDIPRATVYPSPTLAGDFIFYSNERGHTVVMRPGAKAEVVGTNKLEHFRATPVFIGDRMYIRGRRHLWCIAAGEKGDAAGVTPDSSTAP